MLNDHIVIPTIIDRPSPLREGYTKMGSNSMGDVLRNKPYAKKNWIECAFERKE